MGEGAIIKSEEGARDCPTAVSIWFCVGIGLAIGAGYLNAAFIGTAICLFVLYILNKWEFE